MATMIEQLRNTLKEMGLEVRAELPPTVLERPVAKSPIDQAINYQFISIRSWLGGAGWFFDGKTLFILTPKAARERWVEWAKSQ